jgi:hypothetical protein
VLVLRRIVVERIVSRRRLVGQLGRRVQRGFGWRVQRGIQRRFEQRIGKQLGQWQLERRRGRRRKRRAGAVPGAAHLLHIADRQRLQ